MGNATTTARLGLAIFTKTQRALLPILFADAGRPLHLRELVRQCGVGAGTVQRELARLVAAGIVRRSRTGNRVCFAVDPRCPVCAELRALVSKLHNRPLRRERGAANRRPVPDEHATALSSADRATLQSLRAALTRRLAVDQLVAFGSRARGDADAESDLDVLVVLPTPPTYQDRQVVSQCAWEAGLAHGVVVAAVVVSRGDWENGPERSSLLGLAVRREGVPV